MAIALRFRIGALTVAVVLALHGIASAQTARLSGAVSDSTQAVVPGATITVTKVDSNDIRVAVSNASGQFNVPFLPSERRNSDCWRSSERHRPARPGPFTSGGYS